VFILSFAATSLFDFVPEATLRRPDVFASVHTALRIL
jgi:hypothetical protein